MASLFDVCCGPAPEDTIVPYVADDELEKPAEPEKIEMAQMPEDTLWMLHTLSLRSLLGTFTAVVAVFAVTVSTHPKHPKR